MSRNKRKANLDLGGENTCDALIIVPGIPTRRPYLVFRGNDYLARRDD